jgi:hypothetical protein
MLSVTIGVDGLGLISYNDFVDGKLKVAHCDDAVCSSATVSNLDSVGLTGVGFVRSNTSVAVGADGLGLIAYSDFAAGLKVAHCTNSLCDFPQADLSVTKTDEQTNAEQGCLWCTRSSSRTRGRARRRKH